jgi:hypothetical protein
MEVARNQPNYRFSRITGKPVIPGRKIFTMTNSVKIQMQKNRLSLSSVVILEQISLKRVWVSQILTFYEAIFG